MCIEYSRKCLEYRRKCVESGVYPACRHSPELRGLRGTNTPEFNIQHRYSVH
jgi:hypothetical protein